MTDNRCVESGGYFIPINSPVFGGVKKKYKCRNPAFAQALVLRDRGRWVNMPDEYVYACQTIPLWHEWGGGLMIPRGIDLGEYGLENINRTTFPTLRTEDERLEFVQGIQLRDYQAEGVDALERKEQGLIVAPCGAGKTMMGMGAILRYNTRAVILVHTNDLAEQWKSRIEAQVKTCTGGVPNVTVWGGGKKDDTGQVVIAMFQSLSKMRFDEMLEFGKQFGVCIVDEAHHVPAATFSEVMMGMPAKIRLALTATPDRPDGLSDILYWHFGETLKRITTPELIENGSVLAPLVKFTATYWKPSGKKDWIKMINDMCSDVDRNEQILSMVENMVSNGRQVLVLSDRVQHCVDMAEQTASRGISAATLVGKMTKKQRAEVLELADSREIKALFATTVADEGLDLPGLDTLILTTPTKSMGRIQQRIGRIMRRADNKKDPIVIDLVDAAPALFYMHKKRWKLYTDIGCTVERIAVRAS
jgi:superfamily II DNA or RNA helicase